MKKLIVLVLLIAMALPLAACAGKPEEPVDDTLSFDAPTPTPTLVINVEPTASPETALPEAEQSPDASPTPEPTPVSTVNPEAVEELKDQPKNRSAAEKINSDVIGWIKVPNTNIDYPILYSSSFYYNSHDIYKKSSNNGTIYAYYNMLTKNNTITGHNMRKAGIMFHELHKLQNNAENLKTKKNRTFSIDWFTLTSWEVFALYETKDTEPKSTLLYNTNHLAKSTTAEVQEWIDTQIKRSEIDLGVKPSTNDYFVTLVTCGDNYDNSDAQSRLYFFLRCPDPAK